MYHSTLGRGSPGNKRQKMKDVENLVAVLVNNFLKYDCSDFSKKSLLPTLILPIYMNEQHLVTCRVQMNEYKEF